MAKEFTMPILATPNVSSSGLPKNFTWRPKPLQIEQAIQNHNQSLFDLKRRGGLSWSELAAVLESRPYAHPYGGELSAAKRCIAIRAKELMEYEGLDSSQAIAKALKGA